VLETLVEPEQERWADSNLPLISSDIEVDVYGILQCLDREPASE